VLVEILLFMLLFVVVVCACACLIMWTVSYIKKELQNARGPDPRTDHRDFSDTSGSVRIRSESAVDQDS
jgi:hypothetical protein